VASETVASDAAASNAAASNAVASDAVGGITPGNHPYHAAGLYYLQEPSAMLAVELLDPQPGERILDLAAAPGGKASHIAAKMQNQGVLVANEIHPRRVWDLAQNLERCGVRNTMILNESAERIASQFGEIFDRVLLDAPCSGEGLFRKNPQARQQWSLEAVTGCALRQATLLDLASHLVRPGGLLAYSTCTFSPDENEATIAGFLHNHAQFSVEAIDAQPGFSPGRPDWIPELHSSEVHNTIRLWPHRIPGEGHFVALLRKRMTDNTCSPGVGSRLRLPNKIYDLVDRFSRDCLNLDLEFTNLNLVGSYVYHLPENHLETANLRVIHPGWWLGVVRKDRFEPSHALAMGLKQAELRRVISLRVEQLDLVLDYLRGENIMDKLVEISHSSDGWSVITLDSYPLGWGKQVKGLIKNNYPRGLRRF
jgi:NOL1/NOP2/sun family putative RNA methylase